jgi:hypothetical protein
MVGAFKNDADDIRFGKPKVQSIMNNAEIQAIFDTQHRVKVYQKKYSKLKRWVTLDYTKTRGKGGYYHNH